MLLNAKIKRCKYDLIQTNLAMNKALYNINFWRFTSSGMWPCDVGQVLQFPTFRRIVVPSHESSLVKIYWRFKETYCLHYHSTLITRRWTVFIGNVSMFPWHYTASHTGRRVIFTVTVVRTANLTRYTKIYIIYDYHNTAVILRPMFLLSLANSRTHHW